MKPSVCYFASVICIGALDDDSILLRFPKYKLRELILAPIQVSLESSNSRLNGDALSALEVQLLF